MTNDFSKLLSSFFTSYLDKQRGLSQATINSYIETFIQFFDFLESKNIKIKKISFKDFTKANVEKYMESIIDKGNVAHTRNQRLSAIHSFSQYVIQENLKYYDECLSILGIPMMRVDKKEVDYLEKEAMQLLLSTPKLNTESGIRDATILTMLYSSGCRVTEFINIKMSNLDFQYNTVGILGKGNKHRKVPINKQTIKLLKKYIEIYKPTEYLFLNHQHLKMTRAGIAYIIQKNVEKCKKANPNFTNKKISPHTFRHSIATHLLDNGIPLIYIRDFLGHESVKATEIYAKANKKVIKEALSKQGESLKTNKMNIAKRDDKIKDYLKTLKK